VTGWKAAGVPVTVKKATRTTVDVDAALTVATGYDAATIKASVSSVIFTYLSTLPVGATFYRSEVIARAKAVAGVTDIVQTTPVGNIIPAAHEKLAPGAITVT
jgi:phage-related baseplate assembly protein